ncbi:beta-lactamase family protein [Pseudoduganella flava]|nr:MBL fold metallo-hydrolase [Pseudoduganella flava]TWI40181.1 beta-lactamase family protein [Pseudoduganella flava]
MKTPLAWWTMLWSTLLLIASCAQAADVPRFRITIPSGADRFDPGGAVQFVGKATVLVRVRGLAVLVDPGSDDGTADAWQAAQLADVVLLSQPDAPALAAWSARPVVAMTGTAAVLRGQGWQSVYPLDTWEGITIRKGDTRLRLTAMPDPRGMRPATLAAMLDFGPACRVLVHHGALANDDIALIPQRFPGARLALLRQDGTPSLLTVHPGGHEATLRHPVARGQPYRFGSADCR